MDHGAESSVHRWWHIHSLGGRVTKKWGPRRVSVIVDERKIEDQKQPTKIRFIDSGIFS